MYTYKYVAVCMDSDCANLFHIQIPLVLTNKRLFITVLHSARSFFYQILIHVEAFQNIYYY